MDHCVAGSFCTAAPAVVADSDVDESGTSPATPAALDSWRFRKPGLKLSSLSVLKQHQQ